MAAGSYAGLVYRHPRRVAHYLGVSRHHCRGAAARQARRHLQGLCGGGLIVAAIAIGGGMADASRPFGSGGQPVDCDARGIDRLGALFRPERNALGTDERHIVDAEEPEDAAQIGFLVIEEGGGRLRAVVAAA